MFTKTQFKVILILLDDAGHAGWEIAKHLKMGDSNLNPILKGLESKGIIFQGEARKSGKKQKRKGDYKEFPYYITKNIDALRIIINEIAESKKIFDTGFILGILKQSKYLEVMREKFEEDVNRAIAEELKRSYPPYADSFILNVLKPPLKDIFFSRSAPKGLELWYFRYLHTLPKNKDSWILSTILSQVDAD